MSVARYASLVAFSQARAFCPTGSGNGIDNSCGSSQSSQTFPKGSQNLRDAVDSVSPDPSAIWDRSKGLADTPSQRQMNSIADEQTSHSGKPLTPEAEASYKSLIDEIGRQYESLTAAGLKARAWHGEGEPYGDPPGSSKPNSNRMREEVAKTGDFNFYRTESGFGSGDATPNHPMLRETKYKTADGEPMVANDLFRVVHDMVAHVRGGYSFSTNGEYNGMLTHASTLPESAWPALFAETFGQNAVYEKTKKYAPQNAYASKIGPEVIRGELKKRTNGSRSLKDDGDEPLGYQHRKVRPWLMSKKETRKAVSIATHASLLAFLESRDRQLGLLMADCDRNPDGTFASGNECGATTGRASSPYRDLPDSIRLTPEGSTVNYDGRQLEHGVPFASASKAASLSIKSPQGCMDAARKAGIKDPSDLLVIGAATGSGARVQIQPRMGVYGGALASGVAIASTTPLVPSRTSLGSVDIRVTVNGNKSVHYDNFLPDRTSFESIARGDASTATLSGAILHMMAQSLEAAEANGMEYADTFAAGSGTGSFTSGGNGDYQGYRLWPKFGFDASLDSGFARAFTNDNPSLVTDDIRDYMSANGGRISLQQIVATPAGEDWWNKNGRGTGMKLDFTDKESLGYKRFQRMLKAGKRAGARLAREGRSEVEFWEYVSRTSGIPTYVEFRDCGKDEDGRFSKGNTCAGGIAQDAASGAAKGALLGAIGAVAKSWVVQSAPPAAAVGAVAGAVKGIYDNQMRPTRVSARMKKVGLTDDNVASMVKTLGGTSKSRASLSGSGGLTLTIKDKSGKTSHVVDISDKSISVYPLTDKKEMSDSQIESIRKIAEEASPKQTTIAVKSDSLSYASRLAKKGFVVTAKHAGLILATAVLSNAAPAAPDIVLGVADLALDTHFTDSFYKKANKSAKR